MKANYKVSNLYLGRRVRLCHEACAGAGWPEGARPEPACPPGRLPAACAPLPETPPQCPVLLLPLSTIQINKNY